MKLSNITITENAEGLRLHAYPDSGGIWTIGYGHTHDVKAGQIITIDIAKQFLLEDMGSVENYLNSQNLNLNQNQFDALADFIFNCGQGNFHKWGLLDLVKANPNDPKIGVNISTHIHDAKGNSLPGLVKRRLAETTLYYKPI